MLAFAVPAKRHELLAAAQHATNAGLAMPALQDGVFPVPVYVLLSDAMDGDVRSKQMTRDLTGEQFGRWRVLGAAQANPRRRMWSVVCGCGARKAVRGDILLSGHSTQCRGCASRERATKHGLSAHPLYAAWKEMHARCANPRNHAYVDYGARGVSVCPRWYDFESYVADVGARPKGKSLDRINNDGPYSPDNVRWSTPMEQARNRRKRRRAEVLRTLGVTCEL